MPKRGINGAVLRAIGAPDHTVRVTRVEDITSYFRRIWFESETLFNDYDPIPSNWLRFWFPDPQNPDVEQQRAYTALHADPDTGTFCCDFIMHQPGGPASLWAENAAPGDEVEVTISGSPRLPVNLAEPEGYLLMGDATAIPAMNAIVEALPDTMPIEMYVGYITDEERDIPLAQHPHLNLHLMDIEDSSTLAQAIEDRDWSNWYGWAGAEVDSTKTTRIRLRDEFGFPKTDMYIHAYWVEGRSMGKTKDKKETQAAKKSAASDAFIPSPDIKKAAAERRSNWRSQAGAKLLAPLKGKLIVAGLIQFFITLLELAPFVPPHRALTPTAPERTGREALEPRFLGTGHHGPECLTHHPSHPLTALGRRRVCPRSAQAAARQALPPATRLVHRPHLRRYQAARTGRPASTAPPGHPFHSAGRSRSARPHCRPHLPVDGGCEDDAAALRPHPHLPHHHEPRGHSVCDRNLHHAEVD